MSDSMSFDDVVATSIRSGHLSEDEITEMKKLLDEMRRLAGIGSADIKVDKKINELTNRFNWFAAKGMPELAAKHGVHANDYMAPPKGKSTKRLIFILAVLVSVIVIFEMFNSNV